MQRSLKQIADALGLPLEGEDAVIVRPSLIPDAGPGTITLATSERYAADAAARGSTALLAPPEVLTALPVLRSSRPRLDFARVLALFDERPAPPPGIHATACVSPTACLGDGVSIGNHVTVEEGARVGARTSIGPNAFIGQGAVLGEDCVLGPSVVVYDGCVLGDRVRLQAGTVIGSDGYGYEWDGERHVRVPHLGRVILEDDVETGGNCCLDRGKTGDTRIGRGTKLDNLVHIGHGVVVGPHCVIVGQVGIAGSAVLEQGVILAGQVGIADGLHIGAGAVVSAKSGVTSDLEAGRTYMGYPIREAAEARRIFASLTRLPDLIRRVRALEKREEDARSQPAETPPEREG